MLQNSEKAKSLFSCPVQISRAGNIPLMYTIQRVTVREAQNKLNSFIPKDGRRQSKWKSNKTNTNNASVPAVQQQNRSNYESCSPLTNVFQHQITMTRSPTVPVQSSGSYYIDKYVARNYFHQNYASCLIVKQTRISQETIPLLQNKDPTWFGPLTE